MKNMEFMPTNTFEIGKMDIRTMKETFRPGNLPLQGMAYGVLSGLGPVYGLYTTAFPVSLYFFLGTSRQLALGVSQTF